MILVPLLSQIACNGLPPKLEFLEEKQLKNKLKMAFNLAHTNILNWLLDIRVKIAGLKGRISQKG